MIERPILMSGEMVRASMREVDPKTHTRRVVRPQPPDKMAQFYPFARMHGSILRFHKNEDAEFPMWAHHIECPYGKPGDRLWVRESALYKSECGGYYCRVTDCWGNFEAWTIDGKTHWHHDDRIKTWEDAAKPHRPLEYCVGGFSAEMGGQKKHSFTLTLLRCDTNKIIEPYQGNTID
ncbi:MAG: hypothetical protein ACJ71W_21910 [Terriglobales bacterium]